MSSMWHSFLVELWGPLEAALDHHNFFHSLYPSVIYRHGLFYAHQPLETVGLNLKIFMVERLLNYKTAGLKARII